MPQVNSFARFFSAVYPAENDVRQGSPTYGDAINVLNGTLVVGGTDPNYPPESRVIAGIQYGTTGSEEFTGNFEFAPENKVEAGYQYGSNGVELTGSLQAGVPADPGDVRFGVSYNQPDTLVGTLGLPTEAQVLIGVGFGTEFTEFEGTLTDLPGGTGQILPPVLGSGQLRSPLVIGDSFLAANGNAFEWTIPPQLGFTTGATARFYGRPSCCTTDCAEDRSWDLTTNPVLDGTNWQLSFDMTSAQSGVIPVGCHEWYLVLEEGGSEITIELGEVDWVCR